MPTAANRSTTVASLASDAKKWSTPPSFRYADMLSDELARVILVKVGKSAGVEISEYKLATNQKINDVKYGTRVSRNMLPQ
jgi:hypothetical protein